MTKTGVPSVAVAAGGHEVVVTNPGKLLIRPARLTKLDLVNYYIAVAPGALRGAGVCSAYSVRPNAEARVSTPLTWAELQSCDPGDFTVRSVPQRFAKIGDPHEGIDAAVCSLDRLLELSARQAGSGQGDAPWPPHYRKAANEPKRAPPSKQRA